MDPVLLFFGVLAASVFSVFLWIKLNKSIFGIDINKPHKPKVPESSGVALLLPFWIGLLALFYFLGFSWQLFGVGVLGTLLALIGFFDDARHKWKTKAVSWKLRAFFIAIICLVFAFFFAPSAFWIAPIALYIAALASFQNTFAGLNGWTGGAGLTAALAAGAVFLAGELLFPAVVLAGCVLGFLVWNHYPAKCLEGDSGTLFMGSIVAGVFVVGGRVELMAFSLLFYLPNMIDFFVLKMGTNRRDASQQKQRPYAVLEDGKIGVPKYAGGNIRYDFAKLVIRVFGPMKEWKIVLVIWFICAANAVLWLCVGSALQLF